MGSPARHTCTGKPNTYAVLAIAYIPYFAAFGRGCLSLLRLFSPRFAAKNPGCIITEDILASVVGDAFAQSHTPLNILDGFKKTGIYPGEVSDRQPAPSKAL